MKKYLFMLMILIMLTGCKNTKVKYEDGMYTGSGEGHHGVIKIEVTVLKNKIKQLEVIEDYEIPGLREIVYKQMSKTIIKKNTWDVEDIAGATLTSQGVKEAVEKALQDKIIEE